MDKKKIQQQIDSLKATPLANLSDAQLRAINDALARHGDQIQQKITTTTRKRSVGKRKTKLNLMKAIEIRKKYSMFLYGRPRLAQEYGVSEMTILKILRNQIYKQ
jgi:hypothetical protein